MIEYGVNEQKAPTNSDGAYHKNRAVIRTVISQIGVSLNERIQKGQQRKSVYSYYTGTEIKCLKSVGYNTQKRSYAGTHKSTAKVGKREQQNSTINSAVCECSNATDYEHRTKGSPSIRTDFKTRECVSRYVKSVASKTAKTSRIRVSELVRGNERRNGIRTLNYSVFFSSNLKGFMGLLNQKNNSPLKHLITFKYSNIHSLKSTEFSQLLTSGRLCISGLESALLFACFIRIFSVVFQCVKSTPSKQ